MVFLTLRLALLIKRYKYAYIFSKQTQYIIVGKQENFSDQGNSGKNNPASLKQTTIEAGTPLHTYE